MSKKLRKLFFLFFVLVFTAGGSIFAKTEGNVYDDAALLTDSEIAELNESIDELREMSDWNVYAVTTEDAMGKSTVAYADDFFDTHSPEQEDGIVFLIDMEHREIYMSTCGEAIRYLTDERIDDILDNAYNYISEGDYKNCLQVMIEDTYYYYQEGILDGQYNYDEETGEISRYLSITPEEAVFSLLAALGVGLAIYFGVAGKYRLKFGNYEYSFRENANVNLRVKDDRLVNQTVTHRRIPKQTTSSSSTHSSSGRSTTHHSSSGRSHGGSGRKF